MKSFKGLTLMLLFLSVAVPAVGQENWTIERFDAHLIVNGDDTLTVTETILVDFLTPKHGIFRDIPLEGGIRIEVLGVEVPAGGRWPYQLENVSIGGVPHRRIRIGDPDRSVSGERGYVIRYLVENVVQFYDAHDEVYWNVTGNGWPVPIRQAVGMVTLPGPVDPNALQRQCFTGTQGSTAENCTIEVVDPQTVRFATNGLAEREGLTVVLGVPKGLLTPPTAWDQFVRFVQRSLWVFLLPLVTLALMLGLWYVSGRDPLHGRSIVPQWDPPKELSPAEVGVLYDERADLRDISATLIHLAVRGFLKIERLEAREGRLPTGVGTVVVGVLTGLMFAGIPAFMLVVLYGERSLLITLVLSVFVLLGLWAAIQSLVAWRRRPRELRSFQKMDYQLDRLKDDAEGLSAFEQDLFEKLFDGERRRKLSDLENEFYAHLPGLKKRLYERVREYFTRAPEATRRWYHALGAVLLGAGALVGFGFQQITVGVGLVLAGLVVLAFAPLMPKKTEAGSRLTQGILGFREYLNRVEKRTLEVDNAPENTPERFEALLPHAIALGVATAWADQFEGIYTSPPDWYADRHARWPRAGFSPSVFAYNMREFSCNAETACTTAPRSSGSSGGFPGGSGFSGGSSGGGGGGGGGGSW